MNIHPMQSPRDNKLGDSQHVRRSSKGVNFVSRSTSGSPSSSKIEHKSGSMPPEKSSDKKGSDIARGSAAQIEQSYEAFAGSGATEEELQKKLEEAGKKLPGARDEHDTLLKQILEVKINVRSGARHQAALTLFESAKAQVEIAIGNVQQFELYKNPIEAKLALIGVLKARNLAAYAIAKKICALNPRKYEEWCRFEEETDPAIMALNKTISDFFIARGITEEMKTKDAPSHSLP